MTPRTSHHLDDLVETAWKLRRACVLSLEDHEAIESAYADLEDAVEGIRTVIEDEWEQRHK